MPSYTVIDPSCSTGTAWTRRTNAQIPSWPLASLNGTLAFQYVHLIAIKSDITLMVQRLLEVKDLCDVDVPDERSVMTYVAEFFHKFSSEGESGE